MCVCVVFGEACYVKIFSLRPYWGGVSCPCVSGGRRGLNTTLVYRLLSLCVNWVMLSLQFLEIVPTDPSREEWLLCACGCVSEWVGSSLELVWVYARARACG